MARTGHVDAGDEMRAAIACFGLVVAACQDGPARQPIPQTPGPTLDDRPVVRPASAPPPIYGGTLHVTRDGRFAVAADPDRDLIHVADLETDVESAVVELAPGSRPFRVAQDPTGRVFVTLRGSGHVAIVEPDTGVLVDEARACDNPRGIAYFAREDVMLVACAEGIVVALDPAGEVVDRVELVPDLRDVLVVDGAALVTRFKSAEVIGLESPAPVSPQRIELGYGIAPRRPRTTAWRTVPWRSDGFVMLHQLALEEPIPPVDLNPGGYGGGQSRPCNGVTHPSLSLTGGEGATSNSGSIPFVALAVDVAVSPDQTQVVVATPSRDTLEPPLALLSPSLARFEVADFGPVGATQCVSGKPFEVEGDFVAVAFDRDGEVIAQTRAVPRLVRFDELEPATTIELSGEDMTDTGHDLFHLGTKLGIACASCHPEGGEDGRVWEFEDFGLRRTPALDVGLEGTEPFHWAGDLEDMAELLDDVHRRRMGGPFLSDERQRALADWMFQLPAGATTRRAAGDALAEQGRMHFEDLGCTECHAGARPATNETVVLGPFELQIPVLRGVAWRPPFMHDGRAEDLVAAVHDMLRHTRPEAAPSDAEVEAVVAYLETL